MLALPLDPQFVSDKTPLAQRAIAAELSRQRETPILETDVQIDKVEAGVRSKAGREGVTSTSLALVTFSVMPSAESMSAELLRQRATSLAFASGVLAAMERGCVDTSVMPLSASELMAQVCVCVCVCVLCLSVCA